MITEEMARFIVRTSYRKLPENVVEMAKLCFLDFLGVALRGSGTESGIAVRGILRHDDGSTVLGSMKANPLAASLANGIFAHSLDMDDGHRLAHLHPGCCVIPAALSLCESQKKSGKDFITAMVVGYESSISMGMLVNPEHRMQGFHSTGTCGTFGAASAACKALNMGFDETLNALGLAGTQAAGLLESDHAGSMGKHLHAGHAAHSGVLSVLLAKNGFTGAKSIVEGKDGFLNAMVRNVQDDHGGCGDNFKDDPTEDGCVQEQIDGGCIDLRVYHILNVYFKKYPICRHLHSAVDAALDILCKIDSEKKQGRSSIKTSSVKSSMDPPYLKTSSRSGTINDVEGCKDIKGIESGKIEKIIVRTYGIAAEHNNYEPHTVEALRQSLPVSLAVALFDGDLNLNNLQMERDMEPEIKRIVDKIIIKCDKDLDAIYPDLRPADVTLITNRRGTFHEILPDKRIHHKTDKKTDKKVDASSKVRDNQYHVYHRRVNLPRGDPENPFKKEDLTEKFHRLNPEVDVDVLTLIEDLESYKMDEFMDILNNEFKKI